MDKPCLFEWFPYRDKGVPPDVIAEVQKIEEEDFEITPFCTSFNWDDEDNEDYPRIAKYIGDTYNRYKFIIFSFYSHLGV